MHVGSIRGLRGPARAKRAPPGACVGGTPPRHLCVERTRNVESETARCPHHYGPWPVLRAQGWKYAGANLRASASGAGITDDLKNLEERLWRVRRLRAQMRNLA